eukprot:67248_1
MTRVGFTDADYSESVFPTIVGISSNPDNNDIGIFVGKDAISKQHTLSLQSPIDHNTRVITNWNHMENIWRHIFYCELSAKVDECQILLSEPPLNPKSNREKTTEIMFEKFNVNKFYLIMDAILSLYATGRTTGVVLDCGYGCSYTVPIYEGYARNAINRTAVAGKNITEHLTKLLNEKGYSFKTTNEIDIVRNIKEEFCYIASDYDEEIKNDCNILEQNYELPDGQVITIDSERFKAPEILFKSGNLDGIHKNLFFSIIYCDVDIRRDLYSNIVLSGGSTMFNGFKERVNKEITTLAPQSFRPEVIASENRKHLSWIGGSILSSLSTLEEMWITKEEYQREGVSIVHRKCSSYTHL